MKVRVLILSFVFVFAYANQARAQSAKDAPPRQIPAPAAASKDSQSTPPAEAKIDPAKEAAIRKLVAISGGMNTANLMMDGMQKNIRPMLSNAFPPGEYRDKLIDLFFEKFRAKMDMHIMEDLTVHAYDKYLTLEEVNGLIQFYSTPLGQKTMAAMPKVMVELQSEGTKWGQDVGRQSMIEVLEEHPELKQAMEDAVKNAQQH